jgi:hypothetical protein
MLRKARHEAPAALLTIALKIPHCARHHVKLTTKKVKRIALETNVMKSQPTMRMTEADEINDMPAHKRQLLALHPVFHIKTTTLALKKPSNVPHHAFHIKTTTLALKKPSNVPHLVSLTTKTNQSTTAVNPRHDEEWRIAVNFQWKQSCATPFRKQNSRQ